VVEELLLIRPLWNVLTTQTMARCWRYDL